MKKFEGNFNGQGVKIAIVAARFNEFITIIYNFFNILNTILV